MVWCDKAKLALKKDSMKKITYLLTKKEKVMAFLLILIPLSHILLFSFDMRFNKMYSAVYNYRYALYFFCVLAFILVLFSNDLLFLIKFDKGKILIRSVLRRIKKEVPIDSVSKLEISKLGINLSGVRNEKDYRFTIPFVVRGFLDKKDYIYILDLFKNVEIEYMDTTHNGILEFLTKSRNKRKDLLVILLCIGLLFLLLPSVFFSTLFILALIF
jgi:hypothetical protein